jgi:hypothetical protein
MKLRVCYTSDMAFMVNPLPLVRTLRVTGKRFVAGAVFEKRPGEAWRLKEAAPILRWMYRVGSMEELKAELERRGCKWEWLDAAPAVTEGES